MLSTISVKKSTCIAGAGIGLLLVAPFLAALTAIQSHSITLGLTQFAATNMLGTGLVAGASYKWNRKEPTANKKGDDLRNNEAHLKKLEEAKKRSDIKNDKRHLREIENLTQKILKKDHEIENCSNIDKKSKLKQARDNMIYQRVRYISLLSDECHLYNG